MPAHDRLDHAIIAALGVHRAEFRTGRAGAPGLTSVELASTTGETVGDVERCLHELAARDRVVAPGPRERHWTVRRRAA